MDAVSFRNGYQQWWTKYISLYKKHLDLTSSPQFHFIFVIYLHYILLSIITFLQLRWHLLNFRLKEANLVRNNDNHDTELGELLKYPLATLLLISYLEHTNAIFKERKAVSLDTCFDVPSLTFTTWKYQNSGSQSRLPNKLLNNIGKNFIRSF